MNFASVEFKKSLVHLEKQYFADDFNHITPDKLKK